MKYSVIVKRFSKLMQLSHVIDLFKLTLINPNIKWSFRNQEIFLDSDLTATITVDVTTAKA